MIPGGRSPEYLQLDERVLAVVRHFFDAGQTRRRHVPRADDSRRRRRGARAARARRTLRCGRRWSTPAARGTRPSAGLDSACVDGNLVTAPAWPANPAWMREFLRVLGTLG